MKGPNFRERKEKENAMLPFREKNTMRNRKSRLPYSFENINIQVKKLSNTLPCKAQHSKKAKIYILVVEADILAALKASQSLLKKCLKKGKTLTV